MRISEEQLRAIAARALARALERRSRGSEAEFKFDLGRERDEQRAGGASGGAGGDGDGGDRGDGGGGGGGGGGGTSTDSEAPSSSLFAGYLSKLGQPPGPFGGGEAAWKRRFFVLRRDLLFYFSGEKDGGV